MGGVVYLPSLKIQYVNRSDTKGKKVQGVDYLKRAYHMPSLNFNFCASKQWWGSGQRAESYYTVAALNPASAAWRSWPSHLSLQKKNYNIDYWF